MNPPEAKRVKLECQHCQQVNDYPVDDLMVELKRKIRKSKPTLMSLNDDCLRTIFENQSLNDLCSVSNTCKRFKELAVDVYRRRHKSNVLQIHDVTYDGTVVYGPADKYADCFTEYIQNVSLSQKVSTKAAIQTLKEFYQESEDEGDDDEGKSDDDNETDEPSGSHISQSSKNEIKIRDGAIKALRFENWRTGLRLYHGQLMADLLKDVEILTFANTKVSGDLHESMLRYLPNLRSLILWKALDEPKQEEKEEPNTEKVPMSHNNAEMNENNVELNDENAKPKKKRAKPKPVHWMEQTYPKLKNFAWYLTAEMPVEKVKRFFEINQSIQTLSLWSKSRNTINELLLYDLCVNELFFEMPYKDFADAFDDLYRLCTQQGTQVKLHLKFPDIVRSHLSRNLGKLVMLAPYIEGLYFEDKSVDDALANEIVQFEKLKKLQVAMKNKVQWLTQLETLEELYIYRAISGNNWNKYHGTMLMLVGQLWHLKKIYIRNNSRMFSQFGLDELDLERRKLKNAPKIKIFFKTEETTNTGRLNSIQCDYEKIEAVRVEAETFNNPLVTEFLTTKGLSKRFFKYYLK